MSETVPAAPRERARPVDPRLLRYADASRGFFALIALVGVAQTAVIVAIAWLLTRAITGVIDGMPLATLTETLGWLLVAFAARAALLWVREWAAPAPPRAWRLSCARGSPTRSDASARAGSRPATPLSSP